MRYLAFIVAISGFMHFGFGQSFQGEIDTIKSQGSNADTATTAAVLLKLKNKLQAYEIADASPLSHPSPERLKRREDIRSALEEAKPQLIALVRSGNADIQVNAIEVLGFARPDQSVYAALHEVSNSESKPIVTRAYEALFQTGLDNEEVKEELLKKIGGFNDPATSETAFALVNDVSLWQWPLPEALPIYKEILKSSTSVTGKVAVANALKNMGGGATDALAELNTELLNLEKSGANFRYVNAFKEAIQVIGGEDVKPTESKIQSTEINKASSASTPMMGAEKPTSSSFPIVAVVILVAVIAGAVVFFLRRKVS